MVRKRCACISPACSSGTREMDGSLPRAWWLKVVDGLHEKRPKSSEVCRPSSGVSRSSTLSLSSCAFTCAMMIPARASASKPTPTPMTFSAPRTTVGYLSSPSCICGGKTLMWRATSRSVPSHLCDCMILNLRAFAER